MNDVRSTIFLGDPFLNFQKDMITASKTNPIYKVLYDAFCVKKASTYEPLWFYAAPKLSQAAHYPTSPPSLPKGFYHSLGLALS